MEINILNYTLCCCNGLQLCCINLLHRQKLFITITEPNPNPNPNPWILILISLTLTRTLTLTLTLTLTQTLGGYYTQMDINMDINISTWILISLNTHFAVVIVYFNFIGLSFFVALSIFIPITALVYMEINILNNTLCIL